MPVLEFKPGERIPLPPVTSDKWVIGAQWALIDSVDIDLSCLVFDKKGRLLESINCITSTSSNGSIEHCGDAVVDRDGPELDVGDDEQILVVPSALPVKAHALVFFASIFGSNLGSMTDLRLRILEEHVGPPRMNGAGEEMPTQSTYCELHLKMEQPPTAAEAAAAAAAAAINASRPSGEDEASPTPDDDYIPKPVYFEPVPKLKNSSALMLCTLYRAASRSNSRPADGRLRHRRKGSSIADTWWVHAPCKTGAGQTSREAEPLAQACLGGFACDDPNPVCPRMPHVDPRCLPLDRAQQIGSYLSPNLITLLMPYFFAEHGRGSTSSTPGVKPAPDDNSRHGSVDRECFIEALVTVLGEAHPRLIDKHNGPQFISLIDNLFDALDVQLPFGRVSWASFTSFCVSQQQQYENLSIATASSVAEVVASGISTDAGHEDIQCEHVYLEDTSLSNPVPRGGRVSRFDWEKSLQSFMLIQVDSPTFSEVNSRGALVCEVDVRAAKRHIEEDTEDDNTSSNVSKVGTTEYTSTADILDESDRHLVVLDVAFCPAHTWQGKEVEACLAVSTNDKCISLWRRPSSRIAALRRRAPEYRCFSEILCRDMQSKLCWNISAHALFSASNDHSIVAWDIVKGEERQRVSAHTGVIFDLLSVPRLGVLASAGFDRVIRLWDFSGGVIRLKSALTGHIKGVKQLAFNSNILLSAGFEFDALAWDMSSRTVLMRLSGHRHSLVGIKFTTTSLRAPLRAVTADAAGFMRLWHINRHDGGNGYAPCLQVFQCGPTVGLPLVSLAMALPADDDDRVSSASANVAALPTTFAAGRHIVGFTPHKKKKPQLAPVSVSYSRIMDAIIVAMEGDASFVVVGASTGTVQFAFRASFDAEPSALAVDEPRQRRVYCGTRRGEVLSISLLDGSELKRCLPEWAALAAQQDQCEENQEQMTLEQKPLLKANCVGLISCGNSGTLIGGWANGVLAVLAEGERDVGVLRSVKNAHCNDKISCIAYSYRLALVATGSTDGSLSVWQYQTLTRHRTCVGHRAPLVAATFLDSVKRPLLVSADVAGLALLWYVQPHDVDTDQCAPILRLEAWEQSPLVAAKLLAAAASTGDKPLKLTPLEASPKGRGRRSSVVAAAAQAQEQLTNFLFCSTPVEQNPVAVTVDTNEAKQCSVSDGDGALTTSVDVAADGAGEDTEVVAAGEAAKEDTARAAKDTAPIDDVAAGAYFCASSDAGRIRIWHLNDVLAVLPKDSSTILADESTPVAQEGYNARLRYQHVVHQHPIEMEALKDLADSAPVLQPARDWDAHCDSITDLCCMPLKSAVMLLSNEDSEVLREASAETIPPRQSDPRMRVAVVSSCLDCSIRVWSCSGELLGISWTADAVTPSTDDQRILAPYEEWEAFTDGGVAQLTGASLDRGHKLLRKVRNVAIQKERDRRRTMSSRGGGSVARAQAEAREAKERAEREEEMSGGSLSHQALVEMDRHIAAAGGFRSPPTPSGQPRARMPTVENESDAQLLKLVRKTTKSRKERRDIDNNDDQGGSSAAQAPGTITATGKPEEKLQWRNLLSEQKRQLSGASRLERIMQPIDSVPSQFLRDQLGDFQLLPAKQRSQILNIERRRARRVGALFSGSSRGTAGRPMTSFSSMSVLEGNGSSFSDAPSASQNMLIDLTSTSGLCSRDSHYGGPSSTLGSLDGRGSDLNLRQPAMEVPTDSTEWISDGALDNGDSVFLTDGMRQEGNALAEPQSDIWPVRSLIRPRTTNVAEAMNDASFGVRVPKTPLSPSRLRVLKALKRTSHKGKDQSSPRSSLGAPSATMDSDLHLPPAVAQTSRLPILRSMQRTVERFEKKIAEKHASSGADPGRKARYTGHNTISADGTFAPADEVAQQKALLRPETSQGFMRYLLDREQGKAKSSIASYVSDKKPQSKQTRCQKAGQGDADSSTEKPKGRRMSAAERRASTMKKLDMAVGDDDEEDITQKVQDSGWNSSEKKQTSDASKLSKRMTGRSPKHGFGVFATVAQVKELAAMFDEVDVDGSGEIDKHELLRILDRNPSLHINQNALYALDHDMSGGVSLGEYFHFLLPQVPRHMVHQMVDYVHAEKKRRKALEDQQHIPKLEQWQVDQFRAIFKLYDKNGDGRLSCAELVDAVGGGGSPFSASHVRNLFKKADKDGNEDLDLEEFIELFGGAHETFEA